MATYKVVHLDDLSNFLKATIPVRQSVPLDAGKRARGIFRGFKGVTLKKLGVCFRNQPFCKKCSTVPMVRFWQKWYHQKALNESYQGNKKYLCCIWRSKVMGSKNYTKKWSRIHKDSRKNWLFCILVKWTISMLSGSTSFRSHTRPGSVTIEDGRHGQYIEINIYYDRSLTSFRSHTRPGSVTIEDGRHSQ
jgi:hypothetical protein